MRPKALLFWSSGKDSAWALHALRQRADFEVVGLVTTVSEASGQVAMHGVPAELLQAQAAVARLPLWTIPLPWPCSNERYEAQMRQVMEQSRAAGVTAVAFGDLFLSDIRDYRERLVTGAGLEPLFPIWCTSADTPAVARAMIAAGIKATLTCVDPRQLPPSFAGRGYDMNLLDDLPPAVDPCGERGEFHTFCHAGPMFTRPIIIRVGAPIERGAFCYAEPSLATKAPARP